MLFHFRRRRKKAWQNSAFGKFQSSLVMKSQGRINVTHLRRVRQNKIKRAAFVQQAVFGISGPHSSSTPILASRTPEEKGMAGSISPDMACRFPVAVTAQKACLIASVRVSLSVAGTKEAEARGFFHVRYNDIQFPSESMQSYSTANFSMSNDYQSLSLFIFIPRDSRARKNFLRFQGRFLSV